MTVKSIPFRAPFSWLAASLEALRRDNGLIFGATVLLLLVALVPALLNVASRKFMQPMSSGTALAILASGVFWMRRTVFSL